MGASIFITATDTDAGKTFVTAALTRALMESKPDVCALKPVCCGRTDGRLNPDTEVLLRAQGMQDAHSDAINLYNFAAFTAPNDAAAKEGRRVEPEKLMHWCAARIKEHDIALIEGVGGLMVPLAKDFLVSDWIMAMPDVTRVLLVVRSRLGGINHALLSLDKLHRMGRDPAWIVINDADRYGNQTVRHHAEAIAPRLRPGTRLLSLPHQPNMAHAAASSQIQALAADIMQLTHRAVDVP